MKLMKWVQDQLWIPEPVVCFIGGIYCHFGIHYAGCRGRTDHFPAIGRWVR